MKTQNALTQRQLAKRWECSERTAQRYIKRFGLIPFDYAGVTPLFRPGDVERMEQTRITQLHKKHGFNAPHAGIMSMAEIKRAAGRRAA